MHEKCLVLATGLPWTFETVYKEYLPQSMSFMPLVTFDLYFFHKLIKVLALSSTTAPVLSVIYNLYSISQNCLLTDYAERRNKWKNNWLSMFRSFSYGVSKTRPPWKLSWCRISHSPVIATRRRSDRSRDPLHRNITWPTIRHRCWRCTEWCLGGLRCATEWR